MQAPFLKVNETSTHWRIGIGLGMVLLGLIVPRFVWTLQFEVLQNLYNSISQQDSGLLLTASTQLVLLNTVRHVPIYAGTFIMAEGFYSLFRSHQLGFIFSLIVIPAAYQCISFIYDISFVFGGPAYLTILAISILHRLTARIHPVFVKVVIVTLFLFGLDWLDIVPMLSVYGFGRGEIALSIKQITEFLEADYMMNFVGLTFFVTVIVNAIILSKVVIEYYRRMFLIEESRKQEERLRELEVEAVESRYLKEIKHLVHDLKTPLVSIQGLSGVIKLKVTDPKVSEYAERISGSAEKMSLMISEILYDDAMREMTVLELFNFISTQLSPEELGSQVQFELLDPDLKIYANKIRLSRALINLIDNGRNAVTADTGLVQVQAYRENSMVILVVHDNGTGIPEDEVSAVWKIGYTTGHGHTGLGLNFVKHVIEEHGGTIVLASALGAGTQVKITLPEVEVDDESNFGCR